jgi:4-oxalocrotonate tautomerase
MPIVRVEMLVGRSAETKQRIAQEITESMARLCNSDPSHIYVMFTDIAHRDWAVAGKVFPSPAKEITHEGAKPKGVKP